MKRLSLTVSGYFMDARNEPVNETEKRTSANGILIAEYSRDDSYLIHYALEEVACGKRSENAAARLAQA